MKKQFFFLSGLPRTGSTLLSAILHQNPSIHAEGNSAVCQLMWDNFVSLHSNCWEQLAANYRTDIPDIFISSIPDMYYEKIDRPIILDKCRSWTIKDNIELIKKYIRDDFKIIVLIRPIDQIVKSFVKLYIKNNIYKEELLYKLLDQNTEPLMRSLNGVSYAKQNNSSNNFLFIDYNELIEQPDNTLKKIYDFFRIDFFQHDFTNIVNLNPENDKIYGLEGMHQIKNKISTVNNGNLGDEDNIRLPKKIKKLCKNIQLQYKHIFDN